VKVDPNLIANILSLTLFFSALFISLRAFYLYVQSRTRRLFVLGLSMGVIALTAAAGFAGDNITTINLNVDWFNYIGQTVSFLFILLSFARSSDSYLRNLMRWHILASALLLILLLLSPVLPDFPNPAITKTLLSGSRGVTCFIIFFYYISAFTTKETRFSFIMSAAFLLLSVGYLVIIPKYSIPNVDLLDHVGDLTRVTGLITLLSAVLLG
jgi:hypothetical protein